MTTRTAEDALSAARDALARHAWREAFDLFREADALTPLRPEDLETMAEAAWWSGLIDECVSARERAHAAYLERGDRARAAYIAVWLTRDHLARLSPSIARGWFAKAERLLEGEPESVEHAYLEQLRATMAHSRGDLQAEYEHAGRAVAIGARFGDRDIQARALTNQGQALVGMGRVEDGLALVDEATVAAVSGELSPIATGIVYCNTIVTCAELADYRRAGEWTDAARRWCERQAINGFPGICRVHRAEIIRLRGAWAEAEREARQACTELQEFGLPMFAADGFYEVGEIRLRAGDLDEAEEAFRQAHELGRDPQPGLSALRLAQGKVDAALTSMRRALAETEEPLRRARLLPVAVEIGSRVGDPELARQSAEELERIAEQFGSPALRAAAAEARARVQLDEGDAPGAQRSARTAWRLWREVEAPYEAALARATLGRAYRAAGDEDAARLELAAARSSLEELGAMNDLRVLDHDLRSPGRRVTRTFMFTDIVRSTSLVEAVGDEAWEDLVGWHDRALRALFREHGGEEVDHAGDGFFVAFDEPGAAVACAVAIQRRLADHRRTHGFAPQVRIGLHAAEATSRTGDYGGRGVHEAARIGGLAGGEEILASEATAAAASDGWSVSEPREVSLRGISQPVRVVSIDWR
ncbi:MAG TPA: adenylate/guanylate cyclase domain-containing protein [Actinomycetota bacterium]|nr:adenylate/guanylate cyclase domain-containing protein [Actinomycetota bacterium]